MSIFTKSIKPLILQAINQKIEDAQELYEERCLKTDEEVTEEIQRLKDTAEKSKIEYADFLVKSIIN